VMENVLIVGAGPTGLVLAHWLAKAGLRIRLIDKATEPGTTSRALAVQARTLELYRQLGLDEVAIDTGTKFRAINLWARGQHVGHLDVGDIGLGLSPYPYLLTLPQDQHERLLIDRLRPLGVEVERGVELLGYEE